MIALFSASGDFHPQQRLQYSRSCEYCIMLFLLASGYNTRPVVLLLPGMNTTKCCSSGWRSQLLMLAKSSSDQFYMLLRDASPGAYSHVCKSIRLTCTLAWFCLVCSKLVVNCKLLGVGQFVNLFFCLILRFLHCFAENPKFSHWWRAKCGD